MELRADLLREKRILLVEDNPKDEALTLRALQKHNLRALVTGMRDGVEALDYLLPAGDNMARPLPRLVLLDLKLPKVGGLEVLRRLRGHERTRLLPVVILTSSAEERDIIEGYRRLRRVRGGGAAPRPVLAHSQYHAACAVKPSPCPGVYRCQSRSKR
jgi:CheY-like chemotaxis protein